MDVMYIKDFDFLLLMKECHPPVDETRVAFFVCAFWLINDSSPSLVALSKCFVFRIVPVCGEPGHFAWRIVCSFRNKYPAAYCSAFRVRGGVLCNLRNRQ